MYPFLLQEIEEGTREALQYSPGQGPARMSSDNLSSNNDCLTPGLGLGDRVLDAGLHQQHDLELHQERVRDLLRP